MLGVHMISCLAILLKISTFVVADECSNFCQETHHDNYQLSACLRGCRLSSINQLTTAYKNQIDVQFYCSEDCILCYGSHGPSSKACHDGCQKQKLLPTTEDLQKIEEERISFAFRLSPMAPETSVLLHQYCYQIFSNAVTYIGISSHTYSNSEQGLLVKIEEEEPYHEASFDGSDETVIVTTFSNDGNPQMWSLHPVTIYRVSNSWIGCVATKIGLPKWAIASILIMSLVTVFYLCCNPFFDDDDEDEDRKVVKFTKELSISANDIERVPLFTINSHQAEAIPEKLLLA